MHRQILYSTVRISFTHSGKLGFASPVIQFTSQMVISHGFIESEVARAAIRVGTGDACSSTCTWHRDEDKMFFPMEVLQLWS